MWHTKRQVKKEQLKTNKKRFFGLFFICIVVSVTSAFFYQLYYIFITPSFVSPIPLHFTGKRLSESVEKDNKENILQEVLKNQHVQIASISAKNELYTVYLKSGEEVVFTSEKSFDLQVSSLQLILSRLTIERKKPVKIDFRFDKPILQF